MSRLLSRLIFALLAATPLTSASAQVFQKQVVVSQEPNASHVGRDVLRHGGNAVDAAIATAFALAVTHPAAGNLGGGGFLVAFLAERGEVITFDFRERAPSKATTRMYLDDRGRLRPHHRAGPRAAGVPGTVRGLGLAHQKLGKARWEALVRPAEKLAREGFTLSPTLAKALNAQLFRNAEKSGVAEDLGPNSDRLADFPGSVSAFQKPDGSRWNPGDRLVQTDLANTLGRIADEGPDEFYTGKTADLIADYMKRNGGLISLEDLNTYEASVREPVHTHYRGFDVYGMGPPASGGIVLAEMLNMLEPRNLRDLGPDSVETLHLVTEAMRRAYFIRATEIADPDFVAVPVDRLISKDFALDLASSITDRATPSASLAKFPIEPAEGEHTTHLSTLDADGNAVALTYTLEQGYGSKAVVEGAGFLLNNEMGDFNLVPGLTNSRSLIGTEPNRIAPRKRMLSSMTPTIVLQDGKVRLVTGSPGGRTIPNTVLWVVLNVLEFERSPRDAVDAPRTHHQWFPDVLHLEGASWPPKTVAALRARGHQVSTGGIQGDSNSIVVDPRTGQIHGVPDRRRQTETASGD